MGNCFGTKESSQGIESSQPQPNNPQNNEGNLNLFQYVISEV